MRSQSTPGILRLTTSTAGNTPLLTQGTAGSVVVLDLTVHADAAVGLATINLRADVRDAQTWSLTSLGDKTAEELVLIPAPTNAVTDAVDGRITVSMAGGHNVAAPSDLAGEGQRTTADRAGLVWPGNAIRQSWLRSTELATANPALDKPDVRHFGHASRDVDSGSSNRALPVVRTSSARDDVFAEIGREHGWRASLPGSHGEALEEWLSRRGAKDNTAGRNLGAGRRGHGSNPDEARMWRFELR